MVRRRLEEYTISAGKKDITVEIVRSYRMPNEFTATDNGEKEAMMIEMVVLVA